MNARLERAEAFKEMEELAVRNMLQRNVSLKTELNLTASGGDSKQHRELSSAKAWEFIVQLVASPSCLRLPWLLDLDAKVSQEVRDCQWSCSVEWKPKLVATSAATGVGGGVLKPEVSHARASTNTAVTPKYNPSSVLTHIMNVRSSHRNIVLISVLGFSRCACIVKLNSGPPSCIHSLRRSSTIDIVPNGMHQNTQEEPAKLRSPDRTP